jgi:hypothetical protein
LKLSQTLELAVWEASPIDAITLTLREAPRISVCPDATQKTSLEEMLASLLSDNHDVPDRNKIPGLNKYHKEIVVSYLAYRFLISKESGLKDSSKNLSLTCGLPSMVRSNIMDH